MTTKTDDALAAAKAQARSRIENDMRTVPELRPQLETLSRRLFARGFDAAEIGADPAVQREFRFAFGVSPKGYYDSLLLDASRALVCATGVPVIDVAAGLGFADPEAFSRWFKYRTGLAPMKLRERHRPPAPIRSTGVPEKPTESGEFPLSLREWRMMLLGLSTPERIEGVLRWIRDAYPEAFAGEPPRVN
ncbi:MAG TPA: helix-turn-helix domain-containing protein [Thermoanaerobaculia bacterium]|jgi:AraC-like DNA-binding protein